MAHFWECMELLDGKTPNYHGEDVGVTTLMILQYYEKLAQLPQVTAHPEVCNWDEIYSIYGALAPDVRKLNTPDTITDGIDPRRIEACWPEIRQIVRSVPSYEACLAAMRQAGIAYATEQIVDLVAHGVEHIHIYTMNKPDVAARIMDNLSAVLRPHG